MQEQITRAVMTLKANKRIPEERNYKNHNLSLKQLYHKISEK